METNEQNKDGSFKVSVSLEDVKLRLDIINTEQYQCPSCHLQAHNLNWFEFGSSAGSWRNLAGRQGFYAICPLCYVKVAYIITKMS